MDGRSVWKTVFWKFVMESGTFVRGVIWFRGGRGYRRLAPWQNFSQKRTVFRILSKKQHFIIVEGLAYIYMLNDISISYNNNALFLCLKNILISTALKWTELVNKLNMCAKRQHIFVLLVSFHVLLSVC